MSLADSSRANSPGKVVPFAEEDLARVFDAKTIQQARHLMLRGAVRLLDTQTRIAATVIDAGHELDVVVTPIRFARGILFDRQCGCGRSVCAHTLAAALMTLETRPAWRRPVQGSLLEMLNAPKATSPAATRADAAPHRTAPPPVIPLAPRGSEDRVGVWTIE